MIWAILEIVFIVVAINWAFPFVISMTYALTLWLISKDISYEGYILWRGWLPAFRFRVLPTRSWYVRLWERWYGQALFMVIVHRDELGPQDDRFVEKTIVHEVRHIQQQWLLGLVQWVLYGLHYACLAIFTNKNPYRQNCFERDARAYAGAWVMKGRPHLFDMGKRY